MPEPKTCQVTLQISTENEGTDAPWWIIIDPKQLMRLDRPEYVASMISGPFFSREEADEHLEVRRHHYSDRAIVFCHSGYTSPQYKRAYSEGFKAKTGFRP